MPSHMIVPGYSHFIPCPLSQKHGLHEHGIKGGCIKTSRTHRQIAVLVCVMERYPREWESQPAVHCERSRCNNMCRIGLDFRSCLKTFFHLYLLVNVYFCLLGFPLRTLSWTCTARSQTRVSSPLPSLWLIKTLGSFNRPG